VHKAITAVALNPAIDRTVLVPGFRTGATNRVASSRLDPGGKGINVARVARALGAPVHLLGFLGEDNANLIIRTLTQQEIAHDFIQVPGSNRTNWKIVEPTTGELTELNDNGFTVTAERVADLVDLVKRRLPETAVLVLAGSLPDGAPVTLYRDLIELANQAGVRTILDAEGEALKVALAARPTLIKPNRAETEQVLGRSLGTRAEMVAGARELLQRGPAMVSVSCGPEGAVLAAAEGCWWATPPSIRPGSTVGAGDSMVAGFAVALSRGLPLPEALRLATAAGTATAKLEGTQVCSAEAVAAVLPEVKVAELDVAGGRWLR